MSFTTANSARAITEHANDLIIVNKIMEIANLNIGVAAKMGYSVAKVSYADMGCPKQTPVRTAADKIRGFGYSVNCNGSSLSIYWENN